MILMLNFSSSSNILWCVSFDDVDCCILSPCSLTVPLPVCCELWRVFCWLRSMDQILQAYVCLGFGLEFEELTFFRTAGHRGWFEMICWRGSKSSDYRSERLPRTGPLVSAKPGRKVHRMSVLPDSNICIMCVCGNRQYYMNELTWLHKGYGDAQASLQARILVISIPAIT